MIALIAAIHISLGAIWNPVAPGLWLREERIATHGPNAPVRAIIVRIDPSRYRFRLDLARTNTGIEPRWAVDSIPDDAMVAVNTGQFIGGFPWGWVVRNGVETQPRGKGDLVMSFVIDSLGKPSLLSQTEAAELRDRPDFAFQSYPVLLIDGELPHQLREQGRGIDLDHRDSRLAICTGAEGQVMIVLTRVAVPGGIGQTLPWGPTVPEMARYVKSLGCVRAMLLDGGLSSQLAVRSSSGNLRRWTNWRLVPLGLVITPARATAAR